MTIYICNDCGETLGEGDVYYDDVRTEYRCVVCGSSYLEEITTKTEEK